MIVLLTEAFFWVGAILCALGGAALALLLAGILFDFILKRLGFWWDVLWSVGQYQAERRAIRSGDCDEYAFAISCCKDRIKAGRERRGVESRGREVSP